MSRMITKMPKAFKPSGAKGDGGSGGGKARSAKLDYSSKPSTLAGVKRIKARRAKDSKE